MSLHVIDCDILDRSNHSVSFPSIIRNNSSDLHVVDEVYTILSTFKTGSISKEVALVQILGVIEKRQNRESIRNQFKVPASPKREKKISTMQKLFNLCLFKTI